MKNRFYILTAIALASATSVIGINLAENNGGLLALANATGYAGCANIDFTTPYYSTSAVSGSGWYSASSLPSFTVNAQYIYYTGTTGGTEKVFYEDAVKLGSARYNGIITITFDSEVKLYQVSVDAFAYASPSSGFADTASLALTSDDDTVSGDTGTLDTSVANYDLYLSDTGATLTTITLTSTKRVYLDDIRFRIEYSGSTTPTSSKEESSITSESQPSESTVSWSTPATTTSQTPATTTSETPATTTSSSSSSISSREPTYGEFSRIAPVSGYEDDLPVYNVDGTVNRYLKKSSEEDETTWYTAYEDVALYYQNYGELPANYVYGTSSSSKSNAYSRFGTKARLYTQDYSRTDGYYNILPTMNEIRYFEADIGGTEEYAASSSWNRGTYRLVIVYNGCQQYGNTDTCIFYTEDHYSSFRECLNYADGWGDLFTSQDTYLTPVTITF